MDQLQVWTMLAESAQLVHDKLYVSGGGWTSMPAVSMPMCIVGQLRLADAAEREIQLSLSLLDEQGEPVTLEGEDEAVRVDRSMSWKPSDDRQDAAVSFVVDVPLLASALAPGRYRWRVQVDGQHEDSWDAVFSIS
jgi:hypothetical protein